MHRNTLAALTFAGSIAIALGATIATNHAANAQSTAPGVRLYVLDCGTLIYNNPESYNLTRQEVRNTNMSVACYLVVHPRGALLFDTGLPDSARGRPFNETPLDPPGHPSLYVELARSGGVVLGGDLDHYPDERTLGRMPDAEKSSQTAASRSALEAFVKQVNAELWIEHDISLFSKQKKAPD